MKTLRVVSAVLTLGALAACPVLAQDDMSGGNMSGGMMGMSDMDRYKARWVYYNLDEREMKRWKAAGLSESDIKGAANIALRTGLSMGYVVRRLLVSGLPIAHLAVQHGLPSTVVGSDIPGMGQSSAEMYSTMMGGMSGGGMTGTPNTDMSTAPSTPGAPGTPGTDAPPTPTPGTDTPNP